MSYKTKVKEEKSVLASGFIPTEPEEINAQWLFEVINQYREVKNLSLLKKPDDILECEINERLNSRGYLSSTYIINCKFKVISFEKRTWLLRFHQNIYLYILQFTPESFNVFYNTMDHHHQACLIFFRKIELYRSTFEYLIQNDVYSIYA